MTKERAISFFLGGFCIAVMMFACASYSGNVKNRFFEAEYCYKQLQDSPDKQQYRSHWKRCIDAFMEVYRQAPSGPWAPAGLYHAGLLYHDLAHHSGRSADRQKAVDIWRQVLRHFPESAYSDKARRKLKSAGAEISSDLKTIRRKTAGKARLKYFEAENCYKRLRNSPRKMKYRCFWKDCIEMFREVYEYAPQARWAPAGLYMAGKLNCELYRHSYKKADQKAGARIFEKIIEDFPESAYRKKAAAALEDIRGKGGRKPAVAKETGDKEESYGMQASAGDVQKSEGPCVINDLRFWSNPQYTRVVVDATQPTDYTHNLLKEDKANGKPRRLYVDLEKSRLHRELSRKVIIDDNLLKDVRAGQFRPDSVRVVIDIKSFEDYKIFSLRDPFRIVIDVSGHKRKVAAGETKGKQAVPAGQTPLAKQLGLNVRRIVIDPGHGGRDGGAPGYLKGVHEKKVVLDLCKKLAERIRRELGCEVVMTRKTDTFLTLEERTAIANMKNADLFISIHTNACMTKKAHGIETYILNLATDEDAMRVAARENNTSRRNISDLQTILKSLMQNTKINESSRLAGSVQKSLCGHLDRYYSNVKDKGVKQAPFYVLLGAQMPSILIETGFISNRRECRRLIDDEYQRRLCNGIIKGIKAYMKKTKSAVFFRGSRQS